ncbi:MAG TPA: hypothetical protein VK983_00960 [Candidatus Limnocylindrales bacterium]|nr:hypothetical protein [Candidatus Limnocylindrales bacterium]
MVEIERKFLVTSLPDLKSRPSLSYERYYLPSKDGEEVRIQKKGDKYEIERKITLSGLSRETLRHSLTQNEYRDLKHEAGKGIERESYDFGNGLTVKIYKGRFSGLIRAEKEFSSEQEAADYQPESWFGNEITHSPLGRDKSLLSLSNKEFEDLLTLLSSGAPHL